MLKCNNVNHQRARAELSRQTVFGEFQAENLAFILAPSPGDTPPQIRYVVVVFYILSFMWFILSVCDIVSC